MENIAHLPWLQQPLKQIITELSHNTLSHSLLLGIEKGYGGDLLADSIAKVALCQHLSATGACGTCKNCQLVQAGNHPDLYLIKADGNQIKIDQIRALCQKLSATAQQGGRRVAVLYNCERLNQASANALLKTLEEPGANTLLVLQSDAPASLLATIKSRCQRVTFTLPQRKDITAWLQQHYGIEQNISWALSVTGGPLALVEVWQNGEYQQLYQYRQAWAKSLHSGHLHEILLNLSDTQIFTALNVLYLVLKQRLFKGQQLDAFIMMQLSQLATKVMKDSNELSVMPNINYTGLCQSYIACYKSIVG